MSDYLQKEERFLVATKCCLYHEWKILILGETKSNDGVWWEIPGGKISKDETGATPVQSLARELREEIGADFWAEIDAKLFTVEKRYEKAFYADAILPFLFLFYILEVKSMPTITLSHEHQEYRWIAEDDVESITWWRWWFDEVVKKAFQYKKSTL